MMVGREAHMSNTQRNRGYTQDDLISGTVITGASPMHELIQAGAATLSF